MAAIQQPSFVEFCAHFPGENPQAEDLQQLRAALQRDHQRTSLADILPLISRWGHRAQAEVFTVYRMDLRHLASLAFREDRVPEGMRLFQEFDLARQNNLKVRDTNSARAAARGGLFGGGKGCHDAAAVSPADVEALRAQLRPSPRAPKTQP